MKPFNLRALIFLFIVCFLLAGTSQNSSADEYQLDAHYCFGNSSQIVIEGRVIEKRFSSATIAKSDNALKNIWNKLNQFFNEEEKGEPVYVDMPHGLFRTETDGEGYFRFDLNLHKPLQGGFHPINLWFGEHRSETACQLFVISKETTFGIISDFDDTVIVSEVNDKLKLLANTFAKNYTQRDVVAGVSQFYQKLLQNNVEPQVAPLFFVTGSPRQIQQGIQDFLDLHHFPPRVIITKKINGNNSDPLFDQFTYKTQKIEELFLLFPQVKFILVGDDGEQDPEVYQYFQQQFPQRVADVWIRQVSPDMNRQQYSGQKYFYSNPAE